MLVCFLAAAVVEKVSAISGTITNCGCRFFVRFVWGSFAYISSISPCLEGAFSRCSLVFGCVREDADRIGSSMKTDSIGNMSNTT